MPALRVDLLDAQRQVAAHSLMAWDFGSYTFTLYRNFCYILLNLDRPVLGRLLGSQMLSGTRMKQN
jgi:hypothetical protein